MAPRSDGLSSFLPSLQNFFMKELDLHKVRHSEVDRLVENFVLLNEPPMRIITGNSDRMRELVEKTLNKLDIDFTRWGNWGEIKIL